MNPFIWRPNRLTMDPVAEPGSRLNARQRSDAGWPRLEAGREHTGNGRGFLHQAQPINRPVLPQ
jgi:hypothetical protein